MSANVCANVSNVAERFIVATAMIQRGNDVLQCVVDRGHARAWRPNHASKVTNDRLATVANHHVRVRP